MASTISAGTTAGTAIAIAGDTSGALALQTNNGTTAVTIDTSQNLGIGTTSPQKKFVVSNAGVAGFEINPTLRDAVTVGSSILSYNRSGSAYIPLEYDASYHAWQTSNTERMRIDSSGNLLVGTTTVYGKTTSAGSSSYNYASNSIGNNADHFIFKSDATTTGSITRVGGTGVAYNNTSDYRLKENVVPMSGALEKIALLKPCTYTWKVDGSAGQGFIAHELQSVIPDAVTGEKDAVEEDGSIKPQGIDQSRIVATLTAAIQELNAKVEAQATTIAELQAKVG
jgi:hypothetical protein